MDLSIYEAGDCGPSGHGSVFRGHIRHLMDRDCELTVRTQQWGWNRKGIKFDRGYGDTRFREKVMGSDRFNQKYSLDSPRDLGQREDNLLEDLGSAETADPEDCIIREIKGKEDIWHTIGGLGKASQAPDHAYSIVETDWNLDRVPRKYEHYAEQIDEIWVPNEWNKKAFEARGIENVRVVPYGVDFSYRPTRYDCHSCAGSHPRQETKAPHIYPEVGSGHCLKDDTFTFVTVARWYHIKGIGRLIEAFLREFSPFEGDDVRLFIKTTMNNQAPIDGGHVGQAVSKLAKDLGVSADMPEIGIRTQFMTNQELMDLMGVADAFALPSRAECVGIAWVQAMHAGTPVLTTDWSAMGEYLTDDHAVLVDEGSVETPEPEYPWLTYSGSSDYPPDSNWFKPDMQALQDAMRYMYEAEKGEFDDMTEKARDHVHDIFDWEKHIETRMERFRQVK